MFTTINSGDSMKTIETARTALSKCIEPLMILMYDLTLQAFPVRNTSVLTSKNATSPFLFRTSPYTILTSSTVADVCAQQAGADVEMMDTSPGHLVTNDIADKHDNRENVATSIEDTRMLEHEFEHRTIDDDGHLSDVSAASPSSTGPNDYNNAFNSAPNAEDMDVAMILIGLPALPPPRLSSAS